MRHARGEDADTLQLLHGEVLLIVALEIGNVDTAADIAREDPIRQEARHAAAQEPSVFGIEPAQTALELVVAAGSERARMGLNGALPIVGMDVPEPAVSERLFQGAPGEFQPTFVVERALLVDSAGPDHHRGRIGHVPETLLAFP